MKQDGGPAFPHTPEVSGSGALQTYPGLTIRDYFAAQALAGIIADPKRFPMPPSLICKDAYLYADGMIVQREK